jgi:hypothetical protein
MAVILRPSSGASLLFAVPQTGKGNVNPEPYQQLYLLVLLCRNRGAGNWIWGQGLYDIFHGFAWELGRPLF